MTKPPPSGTFDHMTREDLELALRPMAAQLDKLDVRVSTLPDKGTVWQAALTATGLVWAVSVGTITTFVAVSKALGII